MISRSPLLLHCARNLLAHAGSTPLPDLGLLGLFLGDTLVHDLGVVVGRVLGSLPRRRLGWTVSVKPGMSLSPCFTMARARTAKSMATMQPRTLFLLRSPVLRGR